MNQESEDFKSTSDFRTKLRKAIREILIFLGIILAYTLVINFVPPVFVNSKTSTLSFEESYRMFLEESDVQEYFKLLNKVEKGSDENKLLLQVTDSWHTQHYQIRLQGAHLLWRAWAKSRPKVLQFWIEIELLDRAGNVVGGSSGWRILGDKHIWVTSYDRMIPP